MDFSSFDKTTKQLVRAFNKNSPTILTGLGVAGLITTIILAIKATPKAMEAIEHEKEFRYSEFGEDSETLDTISTLEVAWRFYIPTAVMGVATIGCMIGSNHIHLRRNAALASLFSITETALKEYQAQVVEKIGDKKEELIRGEIDQKKLEENPVNEKTVILTGKGDYLCYDAFSGRYFQNDIETIRQKVNEFNQKLLREGWLCINEFYYEIGLDNIELGDEMGWIAERSLLELKLSTKMATNGVPCLVMGYSVSPHHI